MMIPRTRLLVLFSAVSLFIGSTLWAITIFPRFPLRGDGPEPMTRPSGVPVNRKVPLQIAWFFERFPYLSPSVHIQAKNHHTYIVSDGPRRRDYVVILGQSFRRVEVYFADDRDRSQVHVFRPGSHRIVWMHGAAVVSDTSQREENHWMWRGPLWNAMHLKIYGLADFWKDAPYKRFSCAGFVHQFLGQAGVHVPNVNAWDFARLPWQQVSLEEIEPGDIITLKALSAEHRRFWKHRVTHVGVYLGNGEIIHAATSSASARRAWVRVAHLKEFRRKIDKVIRPPELL